MEDAYDTASKSDEDLIATALNLYANWIETRDVCASAADVINNQHSGAKLQALDLNQQKLVVRLRELAVAILKG